MTTDIVRKLRGVTWEWKDEFKKDLGEGEMGGVIAQEVREVLPEAVVEESYGTRSILKVDYMKLTGVLIEAVKELDKRVRELENGQQ